MIKLLPYLFILLSAQVVLAQQFTDDFSDPSLDGVWIGDRDSFIINAAEELQLMTTVGGESHLSVAAVAADSAVWEFDFRLDFSPSGSNQLKVYLMADNADLKNVTQGYFIQVGESGDDNIELRRQDGGGSTIILDGTMAAATTNPNVRMRITRTASAEWRMEADYMEGSGFIDEGDVSDDTYSMLPFFGFYCNYTSTRSTLFFFDNVNIRPLFVDMQAPQLLSAQALSATQVKLVFDEPLQLAVAQNAANYVINNGISVNDAELTSPNEVTLTTANLQSGTTYTATARNISDEAGNIAADMNANFDFLLVEAIQPFDVIINEIFADPAPALGLPEAEWIELYNRSNKNIQLSTLRWTNGSTMPELPDYLISPGELVLLCDQDNLPLLSPLGDAVLGFDGFGSLTNGGERLTLSNENGQVIHTVNYSLAWYGNSDKDDGGYSLELINPENPCVLDANWIATNDPTGGTPLRQNSVYNTAADFEELQLLRAFPISDQVIELFFDQSLSADFSEQPDLYMVSERNVIDVMVSGESATSVLITLDAALTSEQVYDVSISTGYEDCVGNSVTSTQTVRVALPQTPAEGNLVINELLFNPPTGGSEYLELYNRSAVTINMADLIVAKRDNGEIGSASAVENPYLLFPGEYAVLTEDRTDVLRDYDVRFPRALLENDLPSFLNDADTVIVYSVSFPDSQIVILDEFRYTDDLHSALLDDDKGVSLERQNPELPTNEASTWQSAAQTAGFGTPTYQNSQYFEIAESNTDSGFEINIDKKRLSPDGDGFEDVLRIFYTTDAPGYIASALVYDARGREVRTLFRSNSLSSDGLLTWDGSTDDGFKATTGIYILWIEAFRPSGDKVVVKEAVVVAN